MRSRTISYDIVIASGTKAVVWQRATAPPTVRSVTALGADRREEWRPGNTQRVVRAPEYG
ncbi:hypothetical protein MCNS_10000 [Mycobacterium conspicuum]|uniref:Uncharacterized protein n=1 Tax=Mycobacterium conspicuum TaxID=44010 RepID=A0A7I7Y8J1_9MYCO|nr:hypothetical protein MCNS_10000 [Mycobacterium conspicuum]